MEKCSFCGELPQTDYYETDTEYINQFTCCCSQRTYSFKKYEFKHPADFQKRAEEMWDLDQMKEHKSFKEAWD